MSYTQNKESDNAFCIRWSIILFLCAFILEYWFPDNLGLFVMLMIWQFIHMYIIGRKDITFDNFDGLDLLTSIPVLYFLFTCPIAYCLSFGLVYFITGKRSKRLY
jgi:hypothetical protein